MKKKKRSFFERITGGTKVDDEFDDFDYDQDLISSEDNYSNKNSLEESAVAVGGELSVDVINTSNEIIIKAMVAGVKPQDLDVQISRDMITIVGSREESNEISEQDYYHKELYWGSFSRNILLPEEIDVEMAEAKEKHGLLEIRLPKIDKGRKTKLQIKSS
jgi:HSP20 family molecular chaperone IbpA